MIPITISISKSDLLKLDRLGNTFFRLAGANQRVILEKAGGYLHRQIHERFKSEAGWRGPWPQLADRTVRERLASRSYKSHGGRHMILQRHGGLIKAATGRFHTEAEHSGDKTWSGQTYKGTQIKAIWEINEGGMVGDSRNITGLTQRELTIGIEDETGFAAMLNRRRPFFYATSQDKDHITNMFRTWVQERIDASGEKMFESTVGVGLAQRFR